MISKLPVVEVFGPTIQGEGLNVGAMCYFVRFAGCDSRCAHCDTAWARDIHEDTPWFTPEELIDILNDTVRTFSADLESPRLVVLTGGNPCTIGAPMDTFVHYLHMDNYIVQVETQGTQYQQWLKLVDAVVVSPKKELSDHAALEWILDHCMDVSLKPVVFADETLPAQLLWVHHLNFSYPQTPLIIQVGNKFVGDSPRKIRPDEHVAMLLNDYRQIVEAAEQFPWASPVRILPQMHVLLWGNRKGV